MEYFNTKYNNFTVEKNTLNEFLKKSINQIYRLLPVREEQGDWEKPLETIIGDLIGLNTLVKHNQKMQFLTLIAKLESLFILQEEEHFALYRKTIFECLSIIGGIKEEWELD